MLPLKLVRYLVLGETINHNPYFVNQNPHNSSTHHHDEDEDEINEAHAKSKTHHNQRRRRRRRRKSFKKAGLLFLPTKEIITNTYRLATIARELGIDFYPTPSLSHIIFSNPSSTPSSTSSSTPSTSSSSTTSSSLLNHAVPIPFPSLSSAPLTHLRFFLTLSSRAFKIVFFNSDEHPDAAGGDLSNWDCCSVSLYSRVTGSRVESMDGFCRVLAGKGWTFFKTKQNPSRDHQRGGGGAMYLFRKLDVNRVRVSRVGGVGTPEGACRVRELRLPHLDFENAPLRILQYILLMTDDIFCLV